MAKLGKGLIRETTKCKERMQAMLFKIMPTVKRTCNQKAIAEKLNVTSASISNAVNNGDVSLALYLHIFKVLDVEFKYTVTTHTETLELESASDYCKRFRLGGVNIANSI